MFRKTDREALKINKYGNIWKIKTNLNKFAILRLEVHTEEEMTIGDNILNTKTCGKILGLTITNSAYNKHISERCTQAKRALTKLYRFKNMHTIMKMHIIKSLVLPILEYSPIPTITLAKTQISRLQEKFRIKL